VIEFFNSIDTALFLFLNSLWVEWLNPVMNQLSGELIWVPIIFYPLYLGFRNFDQKSFLIFCVFLLLAIMASDTTSSQIIKNLSGRLRPCRQEDLVGLIHQFGQRCGGRLGFVSSHAANAFATVVFLVQCLDLSKRERVSVFLFPVLVSYSRIYMGVHFPGDVLGGALVGTFWGLILAWAFKNTYGAKRESSQPSPTLL